jgi:hypothetical protein
LTADAYHVAKAFAAERGVSLGKAISELVLGASLRQETLRQNSRGSPLTHQQVRELLE